MTENLKKAFAIGCHPDDIEFMMSGTLMRLKDAGYEIHYMNVANGSCGTDSLSVDEIVAKRLAEGKAAAEYIGAIFHAPLCDDIDVFYSKELLAKLGSIIRDVSPDIILTHSPNEYMEDHSNVCRLAVTAAFCRGMRNFPVTPHVEPIDKNVTIYHSLPYGLQTPLREPVSADVYIGVSDCMESKREMLALHKSQKEWLDVSQGMNSYLTTMTEQCAVMGKMSGKFAYAEGWCQHLHLGLCNENDNPLLDIFTNKKRGEACFSCT